jgi:hypothetical protein
MKRKLMATIALEELKTTSSNMETEVVVYAQITDFEGLKQANSKEEQEQYNIKSQNTITGAKGAVRVRKTTVGDTVNYVLTNKVKIESELNQKNIEEETSITENHFEAFKAICDEGMKKHRYKFNVESFVITDTETNKKFNGPGGVFEVDVFLKEDGTYQEWCKIDIEIDEIFHYLKKEYEDVNFSISLSVTSLPIKPINFYTNESATEEQKEHMSNLYKNVFVIKNK